MPKYEDIIVSNEDCIWKVEGKTPNFKESDAQGVHRSRQIYSRRGHQNENIEQQLGRS